MDTEGIMSEYELITVIAFVGAVVIPAVLYFGWWD
jgi:hypothetical protein